MKRLFCVLAMLAAMAGAAQAQIGHAITPGELILQDKLHNRLSFDFTGVTLGEALDYFRTTLQVNITLNAPAGIEDTLINLALKDVSAETALRQVTRQAGVQYALVDNVIVVGSPARLATVEPVYLKQYYVVDLLDQPVYPAFTAPSTLPVAGTMSPLDAQALIRFLIECTGPENWPQSGMSSPQNGPNAPSPQP